MAFVSTVYLFVNIAYFAVVSKADILGSRRIVAYVWHRDTYAFTETFVRALFFRNLYGPTAEKVEVQNF